MALRIEKAWVSMNTLLRMQAWHDTHAMHQRAEGKGVKNLFAQTAPLAAG
jgi:hypothetical protein